jgi:class 3 adenylate cyclase
MSPVSPRLWQRLGVRVALLFVAVTLLGISLVGSLIYQQQKQELEATLGALLLNVARTGVLFIDPELHAEVEATLTRDSDAFRRLNATLAAIQAANNLETPIYTLTGFDASRRMAYFMVTSGGPGEGDPGAPYALVPELLEPLGRAFGEGIATRTGVYPNQHGTWITAFAPLRDATGRVVAVLDVDYRVDVYIARLADLQRTVLHASVAGGLVALLAGVLLARRVTGPLRALTHSAAQVAEGDLSQALPVRSRDEVGQLTQTFNDMLAGLRQRDFIRDTFGRYVSPEVVRTLIESPAGLHLGGEKRDVTILMSDLRGYTHLSEQYDPAVTMQILNNYLARMTTIIIEHGGTINEFIGDAIFAIFGAPLAYADHAERAAACSLAMQLAMAEVNQANAAQGWPALEMGIGLNSGEAVVGNIGSEQRAKFGVVGHTVNLTARVESNTIGGQILLSPFTYERLREVADVRLPFAVQVKGISEPLLLYELRGLRGAYALHLPDTPADDSLVVPVALPLQCWVIDDKLVRTDSITGEVVRLGRHQLEAHLAAQVPPTTNVRLRLHYPTLDQDSADLYGKVLTVQEQAGAWRTQISLTAVLPADQHVLETFLTASASHQNLGAPGSSPASEATLERGVPGENPPETAI